VEHRLEQAGEMGAMVGGEGSGEGFLAREKKMYRRIQTYYRL